MWQIRWENARVVTERRALLITTLFPKKMHRRTYFKKHFSKAELQGGIYICRQCHSGIHRFYDEMTLAKHYSNLQLLLDDEQLSAFFQWVSKQRVRV
jgi:hypothetical protein